ncbi:MOSC domain-containing protein [Allorhizobium borbori]|uniref:MOSC domain-containing protein YiiM n=1 Tax=Allorhizobium borbori TaxID=485907 RepID=A0A7W6JYF2_9HYPH|nr:MOSC domain-containing protein [Allorhizobium borbori]MBB4101818.1 MOSC domain-containing protein YiiM [Allorhizobium borbori]
MKLTAICIGRAERLPGKSYKSGIGKSEVTAPVMIDTAGLVGDAVCNTKHHGGPDQAILLEGSVTLDWWGERLNRPIPPGTFGENLVIEALDNRDMAVGDRLHIGDVLLEATAARIPCNTLAARMGDPKFASLYNEAGRPGIYCRVLRGGVLAAGQVVSIEPYAGQRVAIPDMLLAGGRRLPEEDRRRMLAAPVSLRMRALLSS